MIGSKNSEIVLEILEQRSTVVAQSSEDGLELKINSQKAIHLEGSTRSRNSEKIDSYDCSPTNEQFVHRNSLTFYCDREKLRDKRIEDCPSTKTIAKYGKTLLPWPIRTSIPFSAKFTENQKTRILKSLLVS